MDGISAPTYRQLLEIAQELGRSDGLFAAAFAGSGGGTGDGARCLGRTPDQFAVLLWGRPEPPPAGLEVNAPLWYAAGYAEGRAVYAAENDRETQGTGQRRAFT